MLKIGIIGCGTITRLGHAPEYQANPDCEITGFCGARPGSAEKLAAQYGAKAYDSIDALLDSGVDAVSVCLVNADHARAAIAAMRRGVHVLCEKPMAVRLEDCVEMVRVQKEMGVKLMVAQNQRFNQAHAAARRMIEEGKLGRILSFQTTFGHPGPEGWTGQRDPSFFNKERAGFGVLADLGVHKTDLIHYLLGERIARVSARIDTMDKTFSDGTPIELEDNAFCLYTTESGVTGTMYASWTCYGQEINSTRIYGTDGVLRIYDDPEYSLILEWRDGTVERVSLDQMASNSEQTSGGRANSGVIDAFVHSILTGERPPIDGTDALDVMRVLFAAEQSAREGRAVDVKYEEI